MNRRYFIRGLISTIVLALGAPATYEFLRLNKKPDIKYLLSKEQLIAELAETIIPETDSPGAKSADVEKYIIYCVSNNLSRKETNSFIDGLHRLEKYSLNKFKNPYEKCSAENKNAILTIFQHDQIYPDNNFLKKVDNKLRGRSFFNLLKELTIIGYCTSELGASKALSYDLVPVNYEACIPLQKGQTAWATK